jgi:CubicO group peptidase (beta-lactamase class C family)
MKAIALIRRSAVLLTLAVVMAFVASCQLIRPAGGVPRPDYWPTEGWRAAPPETQGFDSAKLAEGLRAIRDDGTRVHSLMLIRDGHVLLHANFYPYDGSTYHDMASVTKSVMTTLIGIAIDQGKLALDDPMVSFFPHRTIANLDERKQRITVRHLAGMTSGLDCDPVTDTRDLEAMWASDDWIQFSLDRPVVAEPGTKWAYCGPSIHLLSAILQEAAGVNAFEFARENLFGPLGINESYWEPDPQGYSRGWGDLFLFPEDAAKLGLLMLQGGRWEGRRIVSSDWVTEATKAHRTTNRGQRYGYAWWVSASSEDIAYFSADGRGGQFVTAFPSLNLIVATTGGGFEDKGDVTEYLGAAIGDSERALPSNPAGEAALEAAISEIGLAPAPLAVPAPSELAVSVSGKVYALEPNSIHMLWIAVDFSDPSQATLRFELGDEAAPRTIPVGLDGTMHIAPGAESVLEGARGEWIEQDVFVVEYDEIARINSWTMRFKFRGQELSLQIYGRSSAGLFDLKGTQQ